VITIGVLGLGKAGGRSHGISRPLASQFEVMILALAFLGECE
jgi:hypothetical protein